MKQNKSIDINRYVEDEINLLDYLIVLFKRKKMIAYITVSLAGLTALISLVMTPKYVAETKIYASQQNTSKFTAQLFSQVGGFLGGANDYDESNLYREMMKSRTILDLITDRFGLMDVYDKKYLTDARRKLASMVNVAVDAKSGMITVHVEDEDPERAAQMANAFVEELKKFLRKFSVTEASQRRLFFEEHLKETKMELMKAEEAVRDLQERTGAFPIESQAKAAIEGMAHLRAKIADKEVQLQVIKTYSTPNNPDLQKVREALRGLKRELKKLETGQDNGDDSLIPAGEMPEAGTEYLRKYRDLKLNETLYELLIKQYEAAKLDEARDTLIIEVVDKAQPPEKKAKPKRLRMVILATLSGFLLSIIAAFVAELMQKISTDPENQEKLEALRLYANGGWYEKKKDVS